MLLQNDGSVEDPEFDLGLGADAEAVPDRFGYGDLTALANFHTSQYELIWVWLLWNDA